MGTPAAKVHRLVLLAEAVLLQFFRRNEFYVVLILLGIYLAGIMILRLTGGIDSVEMQRFVMGLGLTLSASFAAVLVATFAGRQLPEEFENRTLYPLLAKPVSRGEVLLGKFLGVLTIGVASLLLFTLFCWIPVPKLADQNTVLLVQALFLRTVSLAMLAALVLALSVRLPGLLAAGIGLLWWFLGPALISFFSNQLSRTSGPRAASAVERVLDVLGDFVAFDMLEAYTRGIAPLSLLEFVVITAYGFVFLVLFYSIAQLAFLRKPL
jgi:ABC-type transport system involved in multi-copper enzyme maturation permease subunit